MHGDIVFMHMEEEEDAGRYEPLIGYIPLAQSGVAVDMIGHRLVPIRYFDMKAAQPAGARFAPCRRDVLS